jgi:hypothetical protein
MKKTILFAVFAAGIVSSQAALYTLNAGTGAVATGIITSDGKTFRAGTTDGDVFTGNPGISGGPGVVAFGVFSTDNFAGITQPSQITSLFTSFGAPNAFAAAGTGGNRSIFSIARNVDITGSAFANKNIYLFAGNGTTFAESTEFLVVKMNQTFLPGDDSAFAVVPNVITISPANSSVLLGKLVADVRTTNSDASVTPGWQTVVLIPEPSTALLGLIGALGLLRRRR